MNLLDLMQCVWFCVKKKEMCVRETERDRVEDPGKVWKGVSGSAEKKMEILEFGEEGRRIE